MASNQKLSHDGFRASIREAGFQSFPVAENIAYNQKSPAQVVNAWFGSNGHRKNILDEEVTYIGIGCFRSANGEYWWSQHFGAD